MLQTPLGEVIIKKNNEIMEYTVKRLPLKPLDKADYIVEGRYAINIDKSVINTGDTLQILLNNPNVRGDINGGEFMEQVDFETENFMVGIGLYNIQDDMEYPDSYFISYLKNGFQVDFVGLQYIEDFAIAVAWMPLYETADTTAVWYAADPFLISDSSTLRASE